MCDDDRDGDGCKNNVDQHPDSAVARVGNYIGVLCPQSNGIIYGSEAEDHDHDGIPDCQDLDDDNDGIPDDQDPCPIGEFNGIFGCTVIRDCPATPKDFYLICAFGGCNEFQARFTDRINPNPETDILVDRVRVVNQSLYLLPNIGNTVAQTAAAIGRVGQRRAARAVAAAAAEPARWRVELWSRATPDQPAHLVTVVGDYDPATLRFEQTELGSMLAFTPGAGAIAPVLGGTWSVGGAPDAASMDQDQDGMPDGWEIQHGLNPKSAADALLDSDGDGVDNLTEFRAGTDPNDPASVFKILSLQHLDEGVRINFLGATGRRYQIEKSQDLGRSPWQSVGATISGRGGVMTFLDSPAGASDRAFYRLKLVAE